MDYVFIDNHPGMLEPGIFENKNDDDYDEYDEQYDQYEQYDRYDQRGQHVQRDRYEHYGSSQRRPLVRQQHQQQRPMEVYDGNRYEY